MELPGDEDPFYQVINIERYGVVPVKTLDDGKADRFGNETDQ